MTGPRAHLVSGIVAAGLAVAAGLGAGRATGVLFLPILVALAVPYASSSPRGHLGFAAAAGVALGGTVWSAVVGLGGAKALTLFLVLGAFGLLVAAAGSPARARHAAPGVVLLSGAVPGFLCLGTVFYADPFVQATEGRPGARHAVITTTVSANPILVLSQHVCEEDLLHTSLYGRSSIGDHFFVYPPAWQPAAAFTAAALLLVGLARLVTRGPRAKPARGSACPRSPGHGRMKEDEAGDDPRRVDGDQGPSGVQGVDPREDATRPPGQDVSSAGGSRPEV